MAIKNVSGHGVSSTSGTHNQNVMPANLPKMDAPQASVTGGDSPHTVKAAPRLVAKKKFIPAK